jgi:hypothetical protein
MICVEKEVDGNDLSAGRTMGGCLGFAIIKTKLAGASDKVDKDLSGRGEENFDYYYPPTIFMLQLDGLLKWWSYYNDNWREY